MISAFAAFFPARSRGSRKKVRLAMGRNRARRGGALFATATRHALDELGLGFGVHVFALIKTSALTSGKWFHPLGARCLLWHLLERVG